MDVLKQEIAKSKAGLAGRRWVKQSDLLAERSQAKRRRVEAPAEAPPVLTEASDEAVDDEGYKLTGAYAIQNTFLREAGDEPAEPDDEDDDSEHGIIRSWIRSRLGEWEAELAARPEASKVTPRGRVDTKTYKQCKDYIQPLVKLCRDRSLDPSMTRALAKIVQLADAGEFVQAHDAYILIAIGNAAWPIGVTSIGIHTRTAREAVESKNIAHVMNNEMQRKYLTSIKRLLRFAQDRRPDIPPSKKVL